MCLAHDLAESIVGDITPSDGISKEEKFTKEKVCKIVIPCGHTPVWKTTLLCGKPYTCSCMHMW